ncbi:hypothetical protein M436DRAFT_54391 [Aureobasidium namibiae CBS 147.97]|uniref:DH domain-containing protein n=1 Tax=Aureobasidium namibiae CBS 147.97 TaxID=1043004 RepID=A0A074WK43_9PEZI|nr:uncharacterized protein M436DRAFT_54391 [Aureobasidium namibiae CBS 147.97]KEQ70167.1 hypothetical protein M436DRAFT_54391 [Aureobasidium namibiae CBS 147.97]
MVVVTPAIATLTGELTLFHTTDPLLSNSPILVFYGPAPSISAATSRIQIHVFTPAGFESYPRVSISPNAPYYAAVNSLPREEQGDEVCRGLAFGLSKYFAEVPRPSRDAWVAQACPSRKAASAFALFSDAHVAILATRMNKVDNLDEIINDIQRSLSEQTVSWLDLDVILPPGSIEPVKVEDEEPEQENVDEDELCARRYGDYAPFIKLLGEPAFLPTSKLRRAPSKPTAIGRSQAFLRDQRDVARKEMSELVDTESNYINKLSILVTDIASDLRQIVHNDAIPVSNPLERTINDLFPPFLDKMLELNSAFLEAIRRVLDDTEDSTILDLTDTTEETSHDEPISDTIGLTEFAKCLIEWFPKFADCYPSYMQAHSRFPRLMRRLTRIGDASILDKIQDFGEKRLNSLLIEPVQRLPRYTLYIDGIAKQLPVAHPALKLLLKARDIVSEICSQDAPGAQEINIWERLQRIVKSWPETIESVGRLISIVDVVEMFPPFEDGHSRGSSGVLMLFTDCTIFVEKRTQMAMSARALLSELGKPLLEDRRDSTRPVTPPSLHFVDSFSLQDTTVTEYLDNRAIAILPLSPGPDPGIACEQRVYLLEGSYSGKASKFQEEWTKAQVEGRFTEEERESGKWEVRSAQIAGGELNLFNAIFEGCQRHHSESQSKSARVRVIIDPSKHKYLTPVGENQLEANVSLEKSEKGQWRISIESAFSMATRDKVDEGEFLSILIRRLSGLLVSRFSTRNSAITSSFVLRNQQHRPKSPVKMISNFLSQSTHGRQTPSSRKLPQPNAFSDAPLLLPSSRDGSRPSSRDQPLQLSATPERNNPVPSPSKRLEDALNTYLLALLARKGNIVGKVVQGRSRANELSVNELYNSLLEDPNMMVVAAQSSIDVLFAAFEKFLNVAWKEGVGAVMTANQLQTIQTKAESLFPVDFERYFKDSFHNMSPPNQRALRGIVKLLAELLDGTGNDGDRGILTAAFVEILVPDGNPYDFVSLLDRFVEDIESLFGEVVQPREVRPTLGGHGRSRSINTASLTSNTSSFRKKFGFGSSTSRPEQDYKVSVWRTLSKSTRLPDQPSSLSRGTMQRAKTTDGHGGLPVRPFSQEGPSRGPSPQPPERPMSHDSTWHNNGLSLGSIGETLSPPNPSPHRKKRRSSLSDLKSLELTLNESPFISPSAMRSFEDSPSKEPVERTKSPSPTLTRASGIPTLGSTLGSPISDRPRSRLPSAFRKENSPLNQPSPSPSSTRPRSLSKQPEEFDASPGPLIRRGSKQVDRPKTPSTPTTRAGLSERPTAGNAMRTKTGPAGTPAKVTIKSPPPSGTPTRKLRMQSPQKLRERLQEEHRALDAAHSTLQDELSRIGEEMNMNRHNSVLRGNDSPAQAQSSSHDASTHLSTLEASLSSSVDAVAARVAKIQADALSSLAVSESKAKKLDELYREANAENEALYARFNDELARVLKSVRSGQGLDELKNKVRESQDEAGRLRRENARLKREVLGLRSQLKE